jgi:hypothetical protein
MEKTVRLYKGDMDEFGKMLWIEMAKKAARMGIVNILEFYCTEVIPLNEKTFRRRLADYRLFLMHELKIIQDSLQSDIVEEEICKMFRVSKK